MKIVLKYNHQPKLVICVGYEWVGLAEIKVVANQVRLVQKGYEREHGLVKGCSKFKSKSPLDN